MEGPIPPERVNVLGVGVSVLTMPNAVELVRAWIAAGEKHYACVAAIHSVMDCRRSPRLRRVFNRSGMTAPDGMPLVWLLKASGRRVERVYGPDLMLAVCRRSAAEGWRNYFYGGGPGVAEALAAAMAARFAGLQVAGFSAPPLGADSPSMTTQAIHEINDRNSEIVWVGLGTGRQEIWMADHQAQLQAPVLIAVGAAFDFLSGRKPQAPRWVQRSGLEWLFRLLNEPRRLWPRYREYPLFFVLLILQGLRLRRYPLED